MDIGLFRSICDGDPARIAVCSLLPADRIRAVQCIIDLPGRRLDLQCKGVVIETGRPGKNDPAVLYIIIFIFLQAVLLSIVPHHLKTLQLVVLFICIQSCFLQSDRDLFLHRVNSVQVGKEESPPAPL